MTNLSSAKVMNEWLFHSGVYSKVIISRWLAIGDISCWECICVASLRVNHKLGKVQDGNMTLIKMCTIWPVNPCVHVHLLCTSFPFTVPSPKTGAVRKYKFLITCFLLWALDVQLGNIYPSMSKVSLDVQGYIRCPRIH